MTLSDVTVVRGGEELIARTAHLFEAADEISCAADNLHTWTVAHPPREHTPRKRRVRKIYRPGVLLDDSGIDVRKVPAQIRITTETINETILLDRRVAILAGDPGTDTAETRTFTVVSKPELVQGIASLFEAAWRSATELAVFDARLAELRLQAPEILELLSSGCKDETAARSLGVGLRTYRRRVAELMAALGASSRFQAGVRAREVGIL